LEDSSRKVYRGAPKACRNPLVYTVEERHSAVATRPLYGYVASVTEMQLTVLKAIARRVALRALIAESRVPLTPGACELPRSSNAARNCGMGMEENLNQARWLFLGEILQAELVHRGDERLDAGN